MQLTVHGIVIREKDHDDDRILTILTKEYGVMNAYARGAKKLRGKLLSGTELLCYSRFVLFQSKDRYTVDIAEPEENFFPLRQDVEKLALAFYFAQLCQMLGPREEPAEEYVRLLLNTLHMLAYNKRSAVLLKALFELRILTMAGYMPSLVGCAHCGCYEKPDMYFYFMSGELCCGDCLIPGEETQKVLLEGSILAAMRHIIYAPFEKLFHFTLSESAARRLGEIAEYYLLVQLDTNIQALEFYRSLSAF